MYQTSRLYLFVVILIVLLLSAGCSAIAAPLTPAPSAETREPMRPILPLSPTPSPALPGGTIRGMVWHDICSLAGGEGGAPLRPSAGCVAIADGYQANGGREAEEPGLNGVLVSLGYGACETADDYFEIRTAADGAYAFHELAAGNYCVRVDSLRSENSGLLPGNWTFPAGNADAASTSIALTPGEQRHAVDFGWDYQFLPLPDAQPAPPPTPVPFTPTPSVAPPTATPTGCHDAATFVADVTIPDGTSVQPGASFVKAWRLRNNGSCHWGAGYALVFAAGEPMGDGMPAPLSAETPPGATVDIAITLTAPRQPGTYRGHWRLQNAAGVPFGISSGPDGTFWVQIQVGAVSIAPSSISGTVWQDHCRLSGGEGVPAQPSAGCVADGAGGYRADGLFNNGESRLGGIAVMLAPGACPGDLARAAFRTTSLDGRYLFDKLNAGTYCLSIDAGSTQNAPLLLPGDWTYPSVGIGYLAIELGAGEIRSQLDFGWDHQFK